MISKGTISAAHKVSDVVATPSARGQRKAVLAAFLLAASRRRFRTPEAPALQPIRSLSYFLPIIDEIIDTPIDPGYIAYLWSKLTDKMGSFWQL